MEITANIMLTIILCGYKKIRNYLFSVQEYDCFHILCTKNENEYVS